MTNLTALALMVVSATLFTAGCSKDTPIEPPKVLEDFAPPGSGAAAGVLATDVVLDTFKVRPVASSAPSIVDGGNRAIVRVEYQQVLVCMISLERSAAETKRGWRATEADCSTGPAPGREGKTGRLVGKVGRDRMVMFDRDYCDGTGGSLFIHPTDGPLCVKPM